MLRVTVRDEGTAPPRERHEHTVELPQARTTLRDLLRRRIEQEVRAHEAEPHTPFRGLVAPHPTERALNPSPRPRRIDVDAQVAAAVTAFERTRLLVLVDDRQVEDLDAELDLRPDSQVTFVRLVPLAGG